MLSRRSIFASLGLGMSSLIIASTADAANGTNRAKKNTHAGKKSNHPTRHAKVRTPATKPVTQG